jgi:hypothetical protein
MEVPMKRLARLSTTLLLALAACGGGGGGSTPASKSHDYNGTASVGDFLTVTIDRDASVIHWANGTNGESGQAPFTVDTDGALLVAADTGQVKKAYEIAGYGVIALDPNAGPSHDRPSPVFLWEKTAATKADFEAMAMNFIQFRNSGAFEVGCGSIGADGSTITHSGYLPEQVIFGQSQFSPNQTLPIRSTPPADPNTFDGVQLNDNSDGTIAFQAYKTSIPGKDGNPGVLFKAGSSWVIDVDQGSVFLLDAPTTKDWQASNAGTYHLMGWKVTGLSSTVAGTGTFFETTVALDAAGQMTVNDPAGGAAKVVSLVPFADDGDVAAVGVACNGLFTNGAGNGNDKLVAGFVGQNLFFGSAKLGGTTGDFVYGVALKQ